MRDWQSQLEAINWDWLETAYGTAIEARRYLRLLNSEVAEERESALDYLYENMVHQGTRYSASPAVVPFIFPAFEKCDEQRSKVVDLVLLLAVGLDEEFLPRGYTLQTELDHLAKETWPRIFLSGDESAAYIAAAVAANRFCQLLEPCFDDECRLSAGFALAHFAESLGDYIKDIARLLDVENEIPQIVNLLLCLGMLERHSPRLRDADHFLPFLDSTAPEIRLSSAIALGTAFEANLHPDALEILLQALTETRQLKTPRRRWNWWNEGDLLGMAARVCTLVGHEDRTIDAISTALFKMPESTFAVQCSLLEIAFPEPKPECGRSPREFSDRQSRAVSALIRSGRWTTWMLGEHFLPSGLTGTAFREAVGTLANCFAERPLNSNDVWSRSSNVSSWSWPGAGI